MHCKENVVKKVHLTYKDINNVQRELFVEPKISELDLSTKGIVSLQPNCFAELTNLEILWLNGNNISNLVPGTFNGLKNLRKLYLYYNKIRVLPNDIFSELINLQRIELSMNMISALPQDLFHVNLQLEKISLDFNELSSLPETLFNGLVKLQTLILSSNHLISLPETIFYGLKRLQFLSLSFNSLSYLPKNLFNSENISLEEIRLDNNPFKVLDLTSFQFTKNLTKIDILYCTGLEKITLDPITKESELIYVPDAKIDFSASPVSYPQPVIVSRGLRAIVDFYSPEKTIFSSLTEIRLSFGISGPEVKVDRCVLCKKLIYEKDRNVCKECETFYDDNYALGA